MATESELAMWVAEASLRADDREVDAMVVEAIRSEVGEGVALEDALGRMEKFDRRPLDIGVEILGPILIPILIEAGKQLWGAYLKQITEKAGKELADLTIEGVKKVAAKAWTTDPQFGARYAELVEAEAQRQGVPASEAQAISAKVRTDATAAQLAAG